MILPHLSIPTLKYPFYHTNDDDQSTMNVIIPYTHTSHIDPILPVLAVQWVAGHHISL